MNHDIIYLEPEDDFDGERHWSAEPLEGWVKYHRHTPDIEQAIEAYKELKEFYEHYGYGCKKCHNKKKYEDGLQTLEKMKGKK